MKKWVVAILVMACVVAIRMKCKIDGLMPSTDCLPIAGGYVLDFSMVPFGIYLVVELAFAIGAISGLAYLLGRVNERYPDMLIGGVTLAAIIWLSGVAIVWIGSGIALLAFLLGMRTYADHIEEAIDQLENGIVIGCLIGACLRYGYLVGTIAVPGVWVLQNGGLSIGTAISVVWERMTRKESVEP